MPCVQLRARSVKVTLVLDAGDVYEAIAPLQRVESRVQFIIATEGREILAKSGLNITPAETLREAAEKAVAAARAWAKS